MRRTRIFILCLSAVLALAACAGPDGPAPSPAPTVPAATAAPGETVAVDNGSCFIKLTGVDVEAEGGPTVSAQVTNRTRGPILVTLRSAAVNGVQTGTELDLEVPAGETAEAELVFDDPVLERFGITECTDIELNFLAVDADDLTAELDGNTPVHLYPYGAAKAKQYVREDEDDELIFENEYVRIAATSYVQDRLTGFAANLHLVNKTELPLNLVVEDAALNGRACDPYFFTQVAPQKQSFATIYWSPALMTEGGVDEYFLAHGETDEPQESVEEVRFRLRVYDDIGHSKYDLADEELTLQTHLPPAKEPPAPSPSPAPKKRSQRR